MRAVFEHPRLQSGTKVSADLGSPIDISLPVHPSYDLESRRKALERAVSSSSKPRYTASVDAFGIPRPTSSPLRFGEWCGDISAGASVNCHVVSVCPHGAGTHTECAAHFLEGSATGVYSIEDTRPEKSIKLAVLLTVEPEKLEKSGDTYAPGQPEDLVISKRVLESAVKSLEESYLSLPPAPAGASSALVPFCEAIVIRTGTPERFGEKKEAPVRKAGSEETKSAAKPVHYSYTGKNPPYFTKEAMEYLVSLNCYHLLCDLPSVDRENDQGHLIAHRVFLRLPLKDSPASSTPAAAAGIAKGKKEKEKPPVPTITELIFPPDREEVPDGIYILDLHVAPLLSDASPSRPVLYPAAVFHSSTFSRPF